jgi:hypothetical protein
MLGMVVLALVACTVPGKPYAYLDVRVSGTVSPAPAWPTPAQAVGFSVAVHCADNAPRTVAYQVRDITDPLVPVVMTPVGASTPSPVTVPAFGDVVITVDLGTQPAGIHTYEVMLDPANLLAERYEGNNTATVVIPVSDLDIVFATPAPAVTRPVPATGNVDVAFSITNATNPDPTATPTSSNVTYTITLDGAATVAGPTVVAVAAGATQAVSLSVPDPGAGHTLTITLSSSVSERSVANDVVTLVVPGVG